MTKTNEAAIRIEERPMSSLKIATREEALAALLSVALEYLEANPGIKTAKGWSLGNFVEGAKQVLHKPSQEAR